jgi:hypothetical protein
MRSDAPRPRRFELPNYPRSPIALPTAAESIVADFKSAVARAPDAKARPDSLLANKREEIIEALFVEARMKRGLLTPAELAALKVDLRDLQTFVPAESAALVAKQESAVDPLGKAESVEAEKSRAILNRIAGGQAGVANFRYNEPEYLSAGATFMIAETLKWANPEQADATIRDSTDQAMGYLVYGVYGLAAGVLFFTGQWRWGSMQFWVLLVGAIAVIGITIAGYAAFDRLLGNRQHVQWLGGALLLGGPVAVAVALLWLSDLVAFNV